MTDVIDFRKKKEQKEAQSKVRLSEKGEKLYEHPNYPGYYATFDEINDYFLEDLREREFPPLKSVPEE